MGSKGMVSSLKLLTCVLPFLLCIFASSVKSQIQDCSIQGIGLENCLEQGRNSSTVDACCIALNQALENGFNCLCSLLAAAGPLFSTPLLLPFSNCYIHLPPLSQCPGLVPVQEPPASPVPVLVPPDIAPTDGLGTTLPPEVHPLPLPLPLPLNSTTAAANDNSTLVPLHPPPSITTNSIPDLRVLALAFGNDVTSEGGHKTKILLHFRVVLAGTIYLLL